MPPARPAPLRVSVVALPDATASTVYGIHDFLAAVGRDWALLVDGAPSAPATPLVECAIVAHRERGFRAANGSWIQPSTRFDDAPTPDVVCVPDLAIAPDATLGHGGSAACAWLRRCYEDGAVVASACSGAMLLAEAGLLDGEDATTHWAYCDALSTRCPTARVHPARCLVESGPGQRLITAGGGFAWHDLALFLVARFFGDEEAMRQAKLHLIDWHLHGQLPFAALASAPQRDDAVVASTQRWAAEHYRERRPVAGMCDVSGLPERTFKRRFRRATGMSPIEYVHGLRLEEAKRLLETGESPIEHVAIDVGYEDASFFRRLFRRKVGMTALDYRRRFGAVRRTLREAHRS